MKRAMKSCTGIVICLTLLPSARSRQSKVMVPPSWERRRWSPMATLWGAVRLPITGRVE